MCTFLTDIMQVFITNKLGWLSKGKFRGHFRVIRKNCKCFCQKMSVLYVLRSGVLEQDIMDLELMECYYTSNLSVRGLRGYMQWMWEL